MKVDVVFASAAKRDLDAIDDYISIDSPDRALAFVRRIKGRCLDLADFPFAGAERLKVGAGVRAIGFERRVTILYRVDGKRLLVLRILYGGRQVRLAHSPD